MKLQTLLAEDMVVVDLKGRTREAVLREMVDHIVGRVRIDPREDLFARLMAREKLGTTCIGDGVAIPHAKIGWLKKPVLMLGLSKGGVPFDGVDAKPCHVVFLAASPLGKPEVNLHVLAAIAKVVRGSGGLAQKLLKAATPKDVLRLLCEEEEDGGRA